MTGCIFRGNAGTYSVQNRRSYDAWGLVRQGAASGDPKGRYCANLGHKVDDESGLIYMRARYYDPGSGRFVSEDPGREGSNWNSYCKCSPYSGKDATGRSFISEMDDLMEQLEELRWQSLAPEQMAIRVRQLMESMRIYIDMARGAAGTEFEAAELAAGIGNEEGADGFNGAAGASLADAIVGEIYESQMNLFLEMLEDGS